MSKENNTKDVKQQTDKGQHEKRQRRKSQSEVQNEVQNEVQDILPIKNCNYKLELFNVCVIVPILVLIAACGLFLILYSTSKYGSAITHDSVAYIYAAETFLSGKGMQYFGYESPFIQWPPLFPLILAGVKSTGANLINTLPYLNGIFYALIILISGLWILRSTSNGILAIISSLAMLASIPLYYVSRFIWCEPLFIFLTLLFLMSIDIHVEKSNESSSIKYLILSSVFTALSCLTRYVGVTSIITGVIILLLQKKKLLKRLLEIICFGTISSVPTIMWIIRNYLLTGTLTGGRIPSHNGLNENLEFYFKTIAHWIVPAHSLNMAYLIIGNFIFIAVILIFIYRLRLTSKSNINTYQSKITTSTNINKMIILLIFYVIYSAYLLISASKVSFDSINNRLLSPIYPPLILIMLFTISSYIDFVKRGIINTVFSLIVIMLLFFSWIMYPLSDIKDNASYSYENGAGVLTSEWWKQSSLIKYVKTLPSNSIICSNCPDAIYIHSGRLSRYSPKKEGLYWYGVNQFEKIVDENENVFIVWFNVDEVESVYNVQELQEHFRLEMINKLYDGIIYKVHKKL